MILEERGKQGGLPAPTDIGLCPVPPISGCRAGRRRKGSPLPALEKMAGSALLSKGPYETGNVRRVITYFLANYLSAKLAD